MRLLPTSTLFLLSTVVSARNRRIFSRDVCSSSPLGLAHCHKSGLEDWDYMGQALLGSVFATESIPKPSWTSWDDCRTLDNSTDSYCVFSSHDFAGGRGISILTTPERAETFQQLPAFTNRETMAKINKQPTPPFEERELPGRGRGLIANKTLHRGDRIFAHTPVLILDDDVFNDLEEKEWVALENAAVDKLPAETRGLFLELFGEPKRDPVSDRIDTNAFELELDEVTHYAVFPEIARLNHDCRPNAAYFFDHDTLTHYVHAISDINPGTEITITYIDPHMPRRKRVTQLTTSWGFTCSCSLCTLHPELSRASDDRLSQINALSDRLEDWETAPPQIAHTLISLYEQERLHAPMSAAYRFAALTSCAEGLRWDAIKYARLAVELGMLDDGFGDEDVTAMRKLAERPEKQSCWMKRMQ